MSASAGSKAALQPSVLAPHSSTLNATKIARVPGNSWLVSAGPALSDFFGCNGPAQIVLYNWNKVRGVWIDRVYVVRNPKVMPRLSIKTNVHDLADVLGLTPFATKLGPLGGTRTVYRLQLCCTGKLSNCLRLCGGIGACVIDCPETNLLWHCCSARVVVSATINDVKSGIMRVTLVENHVPLGTELQPPPLLSLRPDTALKSTLVHDCIAGRETPITALLKITPALKLAQSAPLAAGFALYNGRYNPSF